LEIVMQYENATPLAGHRRYRNSRAGAWRTVHNWVFAIANWFVVSAARHRNRAAFTKLDDHLLRDIGKSRQEVAFEAAKPFWRE
jgi:uncharacterized protein YjiS (DUF1127 family)